MTIEKVEKNNVICALVKSDEMVIADTQSALDILMSAKYEIGTKNIESQNMQAFYVENMRKK